MRLICCFVLGSVLAFPQAEVKNLRPILESVQITPEVAATAMQQYLLAKAPKLEVPRTAEEWTRRSATLRREFLDKVVFRGWPKDWVESKPKFEETGVVAGTSGYKVRKLRYEIVPGMYGAALLYEPANLSGKVPVVLNVNGHVGPPGKSVEYKQKRCIQLAKAGMLALNLEWFLFGELANPHNQHWFQSQLDFVGTSGLGLFYLAMRRGLDFLYDHPNADRSRVAVTGLSGGGWQTIILSSLDERVTVGIPVAGYCDFVARVERREETGDLEQNAADMLTVADYSHLTAMRAPRPTLLIHNAEDNCCFKAPLVKEGIYDRVRPFFDLYKAGSAFDWHENFDPGDHNYQADNRQAAYRFFTKHFRTPIAESADVAAEIKSYDELVVGLPADNLTIVGLARKLAPSTPPSADRKTLEETVRYKPTAVAHAWPLASTRGKGIDTRSLKFDFTNGTPAAAVWLKAIAAPPDAPATILLDDRGKKALAEDVEDRVNRGERVLALDPIFIGAADTGRFGPYLFAGMLSAAGERAIGIQAAQLIAAARWLSSGKPVRLETRGMRTQMIALVAVALEPTLFIDLVTREDMKSFREILDQPVEFQPAPELFCHSLYKHFDVPSLRKIGTVSGVPSEARGRP